MFFFFSDYFSPPFVGPVMKNMTDKARISREKLAYICDSTSAPMAVLIPFSAWGVYITALLVGQSPITDTVMASQIFFKSVAFNLYAILAVAMAGLIALGIIPEFGPMRKAEQRAIKDIFDTAVQGIKGVTPAILIIAMAYLINAVSKELGAASYIIKATESWMSPALLPVLTFGIAAFISFATGTSWGTYAIITPIAVPVGFVFTGGVFGDHCSPLSDTTFLSSFGAAGVAWIIYLIVGLV